MSRPELSPTLFEAVFSPLDDGCRAQAVARRIARAIELGHLPSGMRLPTEIELAAQLSVATVTLREALAALRRDGLVETRRGRGGGTFVRGPRVSGTDSLQTLVRDLAADDLRDLGDHCSAIRGAAARLAAERAAEDDLARLSDHFGALARAEEPLTWRRADGRFQVEVAATTHSPRLARAEMDLQAEAGDVLLLATDSEPHRAAALRRHRRLLRAIGRGDGPRARRIAEEHVGAIVARLVAVHLELVGRAH